MNYTKEQLAEMAGEHAYKRPQVEPLNKITFNGKDGNFVYTEVIAGRDKDGNFKKTVMGSELDVVFLKIRRVLFKFKANEPSLATSEHNEPNDTVMLFGPNEKGTARELRLKYPELRTQQIVYAYLPKTAEVVRFIVKGSSLGSENKPKGVLGFYEYLATFKRDEHIFEHFTHLSPGEETGKLGKYYSINFSKGEKLSEIQLEKIIDKLAKVHEVIKQFDEYYKVNEAQNIVDESNKNTHDTIPYPDEEEVKNEDIPF